MFDPSDAPRIYGMPPGTDFGSALVDGLMAQLNEMRPDQIARVEVYVNTTRMARRIRQVFDERPATLLPRIRLITDLASDPMTNSGSAVVSPLRRRLELSQFVSQLIDSDPSLAPRAALYDLSDSLASLMEEMHGEGVDPSVFNTINTGDESGHWDRALRFLQIVVPYFDGTTAPDKDLRLRQVILNRIAAWDRQPPDHPIIVAGSTGSRGATGLFMQAVARLPQGAVILPGFDFDLPDDVWVEMNRPLTEQTNSTSYEDHPQFRFQNLLTALGMSANQVKPWGPKEGPNPARSKLVSLSLRPAPVTDQWLRDGPDLGNLLDATKGLTLAEAPSPRAEAEAIALRLRQAAEDNETAALITPDRMLTRQVAAALDRWNITPDDSAGIPLPLSPPGRFLRQIADLFTGPPTGEALLSLLKHPLCNSTYAERGEHLIHTRELELHLRRYALPFPNGRVLTDWADGIVHGQTEKRIKVSEARKIWVTWLAGLVDCTQGSGSSPLSQRLAAHLKLAEAFAAGPNSDGSGGLWDELAGREAKRVVGNLENHSDAAGAMDAIEYAALFAKVLNDGSVRDPDAGHPNILIWGTLEARVQSADLVILGGMNEGIWPEPARPDPWLNRAMRKEAGLLLPERRIGLSAHDYQQAVAGAEVWITRAKRDAEAETVPSRWVNRLVNLLGGLPDQGGKDALQDMRDRGQKWIAMATSLSQPSATVAPATRPSPRPPVEARPKEISVTEVEHLIRDPYHIYAKRVLGLNALNALVPNPDAPLRGVIIHEVLEDFIQAEISADSPHARDRFMQMMQDKMNQRCPWPTIRAQWMSRVEKGVDRFLAGEADRQKTGTTKVIEGYEKHPIGTTGVQLICKTDRIDLHDDGTAQVYDYKTGGIPTGPQQKAFAKQLLLTAALVELGAFEDIGPRLVSTAEFLAFNTDMKNISAPLDEAPPSEVWVELQKLIASYNSPTRGYSARIAKQMRTESGYYDHLSRFGEWDTSKPAKPEDLT